VIDGSNCIIKIFNFSNFFFQLKLKSNFGKDHLDTYKWIWYWQWCAWYIGRDKECKFAFELFGTGSSA